MIASALSDKQLIKVKLTAQLLWKLDWSMSLLMGRAQWDGDSGEEAL